jgi:RNA polymerase sigma-70 factor (ECF subfamily)
MLVDQYSEFAFSVAFRIVNDEDDSNDVVQESFITVWKKIEGFNPENNFSNWLYRIVVNKCYDALRKKKRSSLVYPDASNWNIKGLFSDSNPELNMENKELGRMIRMLTKELSEKQKVVFVLSELEGLSRDDIAEITGMTKDAIKSNLFHARQKISKLIEKHI